MWRDGQVSVVPVPEPGTLVLVVSGFGVLFGYARWRKQHGGVAFHLVVVKSPL